MDDGKFVMDAEGLVGYGKWVAAMLVAFLEGIPELTWFLLWLMALDIIFTVAVDVKRRKASPAVTWQGVTRKLGSLGIIALSALLDTYVDLLGINFVQVATVFYIGPELLSILRSAAILEVPVPPQFAQVLKAFQQGENHATTHSAPADRTPQ